MITPIALHAHQKPVTMVKFNSDGDLLFTTAKEPQISVWRTKNGERLGTYDGHHKSVSSCDVNWATTLMATSGFDLRTQIWAVDGSLPEPPGEEEPQSAPPLATIHHDAPARCVAFSHDDSILAVVTDKKMGQEATLALYNLPSSLGVTPVHTQFNPFEKHQPPVAITFF